MIYYALLLFMTYKGKAPTLLNIVTAVSVKIKHIINWPATLCKDLH